jgi:hypothetical protein
MFAHGNPHPTEWFPIAQSTQAYAPNATSPTLGAQTTCLRLMATTDAWILISAAGTLPTAVTGFLLPANQPEYFRVPTSSRVGVLQVAAPGSVSITEMSR